MTFRSRPPKPAPSGWQAGMPPMTVRLATLDRLLTVDEAAAVLAVTPRMVRHLIATRRLAFVKVGRLVRLRQSDIAQALESWTVAATRAAP
jgi:excisionase family DNA binding protein